MNGIPRVAGHVSKAQLVRDSKKADAQLLAQRGLNQAKIAGWLRVDERTIRRWLA
jgi:hypothetical protein